ncbi:hypothetical protein [Streptomyces carpinensis]|uniref:Uncharacterized protein n=1 Tax=Streptomyces carpinensis TaxID=66369 RepID=A0ABV1VUU3_9ACTN|nr:hypothetical protein [Streptomyces carpinensis]
MYNSAEDDAERKRIEARLYAPPKALRRPRRARTSSSQQPRQEQQPQQPQRTAMTLADAQALMAQWGAMDSQLGTGGTG